MRKCPPRNKLHPEVCASETSEFGDHLVRLVLDLDPPLVTSGEAAAFLERLGDGSSMFSDSSNGPLLHAMVAWRRNNKPVYFLDEVLARTLTFTEVPVENFSLPSHLPDEGMYVALPPLFSIHNEDTGEHLIEGIYLVSDSVLARTDASGNALFEEPRVLSGEGEGAERARARYASLREPGYTLLRALTIVGIGRPKNPVRGFEEFRDDAVVSLHFAQGQPLHSDVYDSVSGVSAMIRVVVNLLYAIENTRSIEFERVEGELGSKKAKKRRPERAARLLDERGKTLAPYTILSLSRRVRSVPPPKSEETGADPERRLRYQRVVSGHFHRYWVRDPDGERVLAIREGRASTLHLVEYLLAPYVQGADLPEAPRVPKTVLVVP